MSASATWLKNAKGFVNVVPTVIGRGSVVMQMRPIITLKQSKAKTAKHVTNKSLLTHFFTVSIGRTKSITDPAPTANDLEQRRHRRDRCIRLLGVLPRQISWVSKCCFIVLPRHERPNWKIACRYELIESPLLVSFPPTKREKIHGPVHNLEETKLWPRVFEVWMEKKYPAANFISGRSRKVVLPDRFVLIGVVVETPSPILNCDSASVAPININVVEVVIGDATGNILPQGGRKFVSGSAINHGTPNLWLCDEWFAYLTAWFLSINLSPWFGYIQNQSKVNLEQAGG
jgi:hypothetical protein